MSLSARTLDELERFVELVSAELGVVLERRIPFYFGFDELAVEHCGWAACTSKNGNVFATSWQPTSSHHELVHGVVCETRFGAPAILAEGLAVAFEPKPNSRRGAPSEFAEIERGSKFTGYYGHAGHFVRWLHDELGPAAFMDLYTSAEYQGGVWSAIEAAYGATAEADCLAQAPASWVPHRQCADVPFHERSGDAWSFDLHFDCSESATRGPYERTNFHLDANYMYQSFLIDVETPGTYRLERPDWATDGVIQVRVERCLDQHPMTEQEIDDEWVAKWVWFNFQHVGKVDFAHPGVWRVDVARDFGPPADVWLTIEPASG